MHSYEVDAAKYSKAVPRQHLLPQVIMICTAMPRREGSRITASLCLKFTSSYTLPLNANTEFSPQDQLVVDSHCVHCGQVLHCSISIHDIGGVPAFVSHIRVNLTKRSAAHEYIVGKRPYLSTS